MGLKTRHEPFGRSWPPLLLLPTVYDHIFELLVEILRAEARQVGEGQVAWPCLFPRA